LGNITHQHKEESTFQNGYQGTISLSLSLSDSIRLSMDIYIYIYLYILMYICMYYMLLEVIIGEPSSIDVVFIKIVQSLLLCLSLRLNSSLYGYIYISICTYSCIYVYVVGGYHWRAVKYRRRFHLGEPSSSSSIDVVFIKIVQSLNAIMYILQFV